MLGRKSLTKSGRSSRRFLENKSSLKKRGTRTDICPTEALLQLAWKKYLRLATESEQNLRRKLKIPDFNPDALTIKAAPAPFIRIVGMDLERVKTTTNKPN